jgi:hypothetical protein
LMAILAIAPHPQPDGRFPQPAPVDTGLAHGPALVRPTYARGRPP